MSFGADGPDFVTGPGNASFNAGFSFSVAAGTHDFSVTSHGQEVDFIALSAPVDGAHGVSQTLTAWTGGGPTDTNAHEVFSLTLSGDGTYAFQLINPLDDPPGMGENSIILDFSAMVQASDFDGDTIPLPNASFQIDVIDDVPAAVSNTASATVDEGGLVSGTPGDLFGNGNDPGAATSVTESLSGSVAFGADGPAATPFQFVGQSTANGWLTGLNLTSHGQSVDFADINGNVLTAWTGGGPTDPNAHEVFSVTLSGSDYTFQLINPLDDPNPGAATPGAAVEDSVQVDLSGLIQAVDFDGDAVTLSDGASVTVVDDVPVAVSNTSSATVDEGGLTASSPGDLFGTGNDPGAATSATISLSGSVQFGADGPASTPFQFVSHTTADNWLTGLNLTSHGQAVDFAAISANVLTAWTGGGPTDPHAHEVFSVTLNSNGSYTFDLVNPLDDPDPGHATPGPADEDSVTLDLSGLIQAVDFDGDAVTLSGAGTITVVDDVPVGQGNLIENGNFINGPFTPEFYGGVTTVTDGSGGLDWLLATSSEASPSNQAQPGFVELEQVHLGYLGTFMPNGAPMVDMDATPGDIQISQHVNGVTTGETYQLEFWTAASTPPGDPGPTAVLDVLWGGLLVETITSTNSTPTPHLLDLLGGAGDGSNTLTFAEIGTADTYGTYIGDVSLEAGTPVGIVDEGGLTSGTPGDLYGTGNDPGAATSATGTIAGLVSFGADGPDFVTGPGNVLFNAGFSFSVAPGSHDFGVMSHGEEVNFFTLSAPVDDPVHGMTETLTAYTDGASSNGGARGVHVDAEWRRHLCVPADQSARRSAGARRELDHPRPERDGAGDGLRRRHDRVAWRELPDQCHRRRSGCGEQHVVCDG